ncbi:hypothetical protein NST81_09385 [Bacillus sp. FSL W8-0223]|uniref:hypothetical protein n=1 Tax=Bacillus sp. FSL W8-0223 TaxID=2954595 RepID=UPI0030FCFD8D
MNKSDLFFVYDQRLSNYLILKGHEYITHARTVKDNREFWLFSINKELQKSVDEFNALRTIHKN